MPPPDPQTMARRSGLVPRCAKRARLLALALFPFSACLNPMPEEFPSNDGEPVVTGIPGSGTVNDDESALPTVPDLNTEGDIFGGAGGSGGTGGNVAPPATQPPITGSDGTGETEAPDAGADAGASDREATGTEAASPEGETAP
jgi:hypothetical protein